jgi:copper oxidase (laccase) domain-containing protein
LGPCCAEFKTYKDIFPEHFQKYMIGECNFDFWAISEMQLVDAGLNGDNIEKADICTKCRTDIFFSYRGEGISGRFATVAMIKG